jgi:bifunctional non-homologous end joining protein LigD
MWRNFVIHEHHARRLHFDLRLEMGGVLRSWAVPKGPSLDPADKRLAVAVPDHSLSYIDFEGTIEEGRYGAGEVRVWDNGTYDTKLDPLIQYDKGKLVFTVFGMKIRGEFVLVKTRGASDWLLIKADDEYADPKWRLKTILETRPSRQAITRL